MRPAPVASGAPAAAASAKPQSWPPFSVLPAAAKRPDNTVSALLNYQTEDVEKIWTKRDANGSDDALHGAQWDQRQLIVKDGRCDAGLTLDRSGFEMVPDPKTQHIDYYDEESVVNTYYGECEALLKRVTGASFVRSFDHNVRSESGRAAGHQLRGGNAVQGPASLVHGDYTAESAPRRLRLLGKAPSLNDPLRALLGPDTPVVDAALVEEALGGRRRFAFVNVWRPIRAVHDKHLACADASTVERHDLVTFQIVYADRVGENYFAKHRERHAWYYFSSMVPDEALLIKQWDSDGALVQGKPVAEGTSTFALHSAFRDPTAPAGCPDRESIEVRLVLVW